MEVRMQNQHLGSRLNGILAMLQGVYAATLAVPNETKGAERQAFIDAFLGAVLPRTVRIGNGAVTDKFDNISGQLDVVLEYPFLPSVPLRADLPSRLYLAEGVAAVIEVKSDLSAQWGQLARTAETLARIRRVFGATLSHRNRHPSERIPLIAVGYRGWQQWETLDQHVRETAGVDGALDISLGHFYAEIPSVRVEGEHRWPGRLTYRAPGVDALWGLACVLNELVNDLAGMEALANNYTFQRNEAESSPAARFDEAGAAARR
jgi:hypothetical protein